MTLSDCLQRCIDDLFPRSCAICGDSLRNGAVCDPCRADLPWIEAACPGCGLSRGTDTAVELPCADCQQRPLPLQGVVAPLHYRFPVDAMIKSLKFRHHTWIAPAFAELLAAPVERAGIAADAIVPVPLHRWRHARRGFNQAREIADELSARIGVPVHPILRRTRATKAQSDLAAGERSRNVRDAFRARPTTLQRVLLLDDVITTGETIRAAALALRRAGIEEVCAVAVARA